MFNSRIGKTRIDEIDIAKAIGIICVLAGHRVPAGVAHNFIYLFHMPLFFVLSGFLIKDEVLTAKQMVLKDSKLYAAYLLYSAVFIVYQLVHKNIKSAVWGIGATLSLYGYPELWFLPCLWLAKVFVRFIIKQPRKSKQRIIVILLYSVCSLVSLLLIQVEYFSIPMKLFRLVFWPPVRAGVVTVFVYLGYYLKGWITRLITLLSEDKGVKTVLILLASSLCMLPFARREVIDYHMLRNGMFLVNVFAGCCGTILVLAASSVIVRFPSVIRRMFTAVGKNSLHLMASESYSVPFSAILRRLIPAVKSHSLLSFVIYTVVLCAAVCFLAPYLNKVIDRIDRTIRGILIRQGST